MKRPGEGETASGFPIVETALTWPEDAGEAPLLAMASSCDGGGLCRKLEGGGMCPAFRVTRDEAASPRGLANAARAALLGDPDGNAWGSRELAEVFRACVSCKACQSECPMGVDIARLKIEVLAASVKRNGIGPRDKFFAYLPHYAAALRRVRWLLYPRDAIPPLARLVERLTGIAARRRLPVWHRRRYRAEAKGPENGPPVVLFGDTFNMHFEPDNLRSAADVLAAAGYRVTPLMPPEGERRHVCCGRTFLSAGLVEQARIEAARFLKAATPHLDAGAPIVGLEPACVSAVRDEFALLLPREDAARLARQTYLFEEFIVKEHAAGRLNLPLKPIETKALLHNHCHQKAISAADAARAALALIPGLETAVDGGECCGMAGASGYARETFNMSLQMAEAALFPAVRAADRDTLIVADGFSCRQQIRDGTGRPCRHAASLFKLALNTK